MGISHVPPMLSIQARKDGRPASIQCFLWMKNPEIASKRHVGIPGGTAPHAHVCCPRHGHHQAAARLRIASPRPSMLGALCFPRSGLATHMHWRALHARGALFPISLSTQQILTIDCGTNSGPRA